MRLKSNCLLILSLLAFSSPVLAVETLPPGTRIQLNETRFLTLDEETHLLSGDEIKAIWVITQRFSDCTDMLTGCQAHLRYAVPSPKFINTTWGKVTMVTGGFVIGVSVASLIFGIGGLLR